MNFIKLAKVFSFSMIIKKRWAITITTWKKRYSWMNKYLIWEDIDIKIIKYIYEIFYVLFFICYCFILYNNNFFYGPLFLLLLLNYKLIFLIVIMIQIK